MRVDGRPEIAFERTSRLLIGTTNPAKVRRYRTILGDSFPELSVVSPAEVACEISVVEDGYTAVENAGKKAKAYADASGLPALSIDDALYIGGLPPAEQPGLTTHRYLGPEARDEELLHVFLWKIRSLAPVGRAGTWTYGICLALPFGDAFSTEATVHTIFTDEIRGPIVPGFVLSAIQLDPVSGKLLTRLTAAEEARRLRPIYDAVRRVIRSAVEQRQ